MRACLAVSFRMAGVINLLFPVSGRNNPRIFTSPLECEILSPPFFTEMLSLIRAPPPSLHLRRFFCNSSASGPDMDRYRAAFSRRMAMAGIKPHHRIALGVSGGADSMALCVLTAEWKAGGVKGKTGNSGFVDGILGIVVDHKLRPESSEEAKVVCARVSEMGIRCKIVPCDWPDGKPKLGHLEAAAREMRYQIFQDVCIHHQIGVLLIGHHADDQAELFILRLSRNSGVLGLAGMAFASQLFPSKMEHCALDSTNDGILLVRPVLELYKEDMYKICQGSHQGWVEDPTNQSSVFARNRIRMSLRNSTCLFKSELHALISACRLTRSFVENVCYSMMENSVTIMDLGYAIVDLKNLNPSVVEDLYLSKFLAFLLQFISQRHRPIRGGVSQLLLDFIRKIPCKTAFTAAGCYLCAAPGSKGMKVLVCPSFDSPEPSRTTVSQTFEGPHVCLSREISEIIMNAKSYIGHSISSSNVPLLHVKSSSDVLEEAMKLNIIGDSTFRSITSLQMEEHKHFETQTEVKQRRCLVQKMRPCSFLAISLRSSETCHCMCRFLVSWKFCGVTTQDRTSSDSAGFRLESKQENQSSICDSCSIAQESMASIRAMVDSDWLYLANLVKRHSPQGEGEPVSLTGMMQGSDKKRDYCTKQTCLSAQRALSMLKSIPLSVRRALPVLVDSQGLLLSIPSCPFLSAEAVFKPRVPLGGGFSSYS